MASEAYKLTTTGVQRLSDSAFVPDDARNCDWRAYQEWVAAGNTAHPAHYVPPATKPGPS